MDPLTHTLVGANLAATRLGEKTRFAAPALIIGANLPDVDAVLYFTGHEDLALGFRRGWTHGVLALAVLPLIQTGLFLLLARKREGLRPRWLLALSFLAILTHPTLDWLNTYGMRWLMPFDGRWSYGDSVYIMDPWLWLILGSGWLAARRPTPWLILAFVVVLVGIARVVGRRSPEYLLIVGFVALAMLAALLWKPAGSSARFSTAALLIGATYIGARLVVHEMTEFRVRREIPSAQRMMVAPHPIDPTRWEVVARTTADYRYGSYNWRDGGLTLDPNRIPLPAESPEWAAARRDPSIRGFMSWVRFPWYEVERTASETRVYVRDARRLRRRGTGGFGGAVVVLKP